MEQLSHSSKIISKEQDNPEVMEGVGGDFFFSWTMSSSR